MDNFWHYREGVLHGGDTSLLQVAKEFGSPCYVYSQALIEQQWNAYESALKNHPHHLCYAVKANSNLAVLQILARMGAGFDLVSVGELKRVLKAGGDPSKIIFSGVGKTIAEIEYALAVNIHCFNVESIPELDRIQQVAQLHQQRQPYASVALRVNPNVDAKTHHYISTGLKENKFGISMDDAMKAFRHAKQLPNIKVIGVDCHIGSQITQIEPFIEALDNILELVDKLAKEGIILEKINMGGGLGIRYQKDMDPPSPEQLVNALLKRLEGRSITLSLEPGRSIVAEAGVLLTQVEYVKKGNDKNFVIVDAGMNDLMRPALYDAWQDIVPVQERKDTAAFLCDVVGPVCESADFLGKNRELAVQAGDYLVVKDAGAYGFVMSSQYNSRPRVAEVLLTASGPMEIRARETYEDLWEKETLL